MHMATKTISIDLDAYERLRRARQRDDESFSQVIKRAEWRGQRTNGAALLRALAAGPRPDRATLARLDRAQRADRPPEDPWNG